MVSFFESHVILSFCCYPFNSFLFVLFFSMLHGFLFSWCTSNVARRLPMKPELGSGPLLRHSSNMKKRVFFKYNVGEQTGRGPRKCIASSICLFFFTSVSSFRHALHFHHTPVTQKFGPNTNKCVL